MVDLTQRQREVLTMLGEGMENQDIANLLGLSRRTVEIHRCTAIKAMGAKTSVQAAVLYDRMKRKKTLALDGKPFKIK